MAHGLSCSGTFGIPNTREAPKSWFLKNVCRKKVLWDHCSKTSGYIFHKPKPNFRVQRREQSLIIASKFPSSLVDLPYLKVGLFTTDLQPQFLVACGQKGNPLCDFWKHPKLCSPWGLNQNLLGSLQGPRIGSHVKEGRGS